MKEYITPLIDLLNEMTPYLLLGFLIAGLLHEFVPRRIYADKLSRRNFSSVLWAALFGIPLPLCSCGVIPTATSLYREGASKGATVSFLISTPQTGVDSILATASVIGLPFAIIRPVVAFITAITGGVITNRICKDGNEVRHLQQEQSNSRKFLRKLTGALHYGFIEMIQDIGKWIVIGLVVAAIITVLLPNDFFFTLNKYPLLNMLTILAVSMPMYLCATGSIPIAAALMLKGLSPGAALVLLMAGPATNMATMLVINKVLGRKTLITYLATIMAGAIGFGIFIDYALPTEWFSNIIHKHVAGCCDNITPWWQTTSSIIFVILLINGFVLKFRKDKKTVTTQQNFKIKGMMCNHCKANVEKALSSIEGVRSVHVDLTEGTAYLEGERIDKEKVIHTINQMGYEYVKE
ncbi:MAG: permease [Bacteroidaceae bacterium]|nr:permease [Bacteroidaceae bacterium]